MKLDRKLNLVLTVDRERDTIYIHSTPLRREVFEEYFFAITKAWTALAAEGGDYLLRTGTRVAYLLLRRIAKADGSWEGDEGIEKGLIGEIMRTSMVCLPSAAGGWDDMTLDDAMRFNALTEDDLMEALNAIVFFIVGCATLKRSQADELLTQAIGIFGGQVTSLDSMAYRSSLPTSTPPENIGEKVEASFIPR